MEALLKIKDVFKDFEKNGQVIHVLRGINLELFEGESIAIMGPSGAGKSTLLNIMGTLEEPSRGEVIFDNKNVCMMNDRDLNEVRNLKIGFIFQFHHLLNEFNAEENTCIPALISGRSKKNSVEMADAILSQVGLKDRLYHRIGELSGGEQQRVAIARALINSPRLLLADEPTGNLDKATGEEIIKLLISINREKGLSLVIVTHNVGLADQLSRKLLLVDGKFI
jgi:lipoprotein-releasing system ATP-binding protein